jgi:hypothetical protein
MEHSVLVTLCKLRSPLSFVSYFFKIWLIEPKLFILNQIISGLKVNELGAENKDLIKQLRDLNDNIELLTKVTAVSIGGKELLKAAEDTYSKIEILDKLGIPDKIIALIIGSTPDSIKSLRSQQKKKSKTNMKKDSESQPETKKDDKA